MSKAHFNATGNQRNITTINNGFDKGRKRGKIESERDGTRTIGLRE